ncbi:glycosyltransferase [Actinomadura sp. WMMB 499]|uniref:glycosyltransferase n=1 Tax=Actinomadura sp. WMMB 499 TaxID=1219491 RepID=UPI0012460EC7|nr:glycosyltransferase [Actinomadura sp. WMMB 499]QFG21843.1 glycosyltransferase [Actinomadura sp. WMMB 499]
MRTSVAVLVELVRDAGAGGHVKCWERFAEAAARDDPGIDLTIYVLGDRERVEPLSDSVRFVTLRPILGNRPLARLLGGVDATDLAPRHPGLAVRLRKHDVWHLTHSFAFARTAVRLARRLPERPGMVCSLHTDVPLLTAAYLRQMRVPGTLADAAAAAARRRRNRLLRACDRVLVATAPERGEVEAIVGAGRVSLLGRGVDLGRFRPDPAARARLAARYGLRDAETLVLFAGRVDASKRVMVAGEAVRRLRADGRDARLVVAGSGAAAEPLSALLGDGVTLLGRLPQDDLARVYAGCDLLAFPSWSETIGNVVAEAMACGLPVVLPEVALTTTWLAAPGRDGVVVRRDDADGWAREIAALADDPARRDAMGRAALATSRRDHRSWGRVLAEDLVPVWQGAAGRQVVRRAIS